MGLLSKLWKESKRALTDVGKGVGQLGGNDTQGNYSAWGMVPSEKSMAADSKAADATAAAKIKQAEFEASVKAGQERLAQKRRKGFGASMLVPPFSSLGSSSTLGV